jgi:hypothetical protein
VSFGLLFITRWWGRSRVGTSTSPALVGHVHKSTTTGPDVLALAKRNCILSHEPRARRPQDVSPCRLLVLSPYPPLLRPSHISHHYKWKGGRRPAQTAFHPQQTVMSGATTCLRRIRSSCALSNLPSCSKKATVCPSTTSICYCSQMFFTPPLVKTGKLLIPLFGEAPS